MYRIAILTTFFFLLAPSVSSQTTRYVAPTGEDASDCTVETDPCATITYTIDQAGDADLIEIADGEYTESLAIDKSLSLHGESEGGTVIQAHEQPGEADSRVITIDSTGVGQLEVNLSGLTIRHGYATGDSPHNLGGGIYSRGITLNLTNVTIRDNEAVPTDTEGSVGGGIFYREDISSTLTNVTFTNNKALLGGGMFNWSSSPLLTGVIFNENIATGAAGGIYNFMGSSPTLTGVTFSENIANRVGAMFTLSGSSILTNVTFRQNVSLEGSGGGMAIENGSPVLTDVIFRENIAGGTYGSGGGLYNSGSPTLSNVTFIGNSADQYGGGMVTLFGGSPTLINVTFSGNVATIWGGGLSQTGGSPMLTNVTFSGNVAEEVGGGAMYISGASPTLDNVIIWNNQAVGSTTSTSASILNIGSAETTIANSLIANSGGSDGWNDSLGVDAGNNLDVNPLFVETPNPDNAPTTSGNLRLANGSPAIDAGNPDTDPLIFPTDQDGDPIDLDGNPRFFDDEIDMGAYENQGTVADEASPEDIADVLSLPNPNPANGTSTFTIAVEHGQKVTVEVFDVTGRRVQTVYEDNLASGMSETLTLDASALPAGVYVIRATGEDFSKTRQVTVVR